MRFHAIVLALPSSDFSDRRLHGRRRRGLGRGGYYEPVVAYLRSVQRDADAFVDVQPQCRPFTPLSVWPGAFRAMIRRPLVG